MIGSHNSGTGEMSSLRSILFVPFARCQSKTIIDQYKNGVRFFDLRVRIRNHNWVFAHGLWESSANVIDTIYELNRMALYDNDEILVNLTYEGELPSDKRSSFVYISAWVSSFSNINLCKAMIRKPRWEVVCDEHSEPELFYRFHPLNWNKGNWRVLFPIPWFWWVFRDGSRRKASPDGACDFVDFI